jgi:hypothetical protein
MKIMSDETQTVLIAIFTQFDLNDLRPIRGATGHSAESTYARRHGPIG